MQRRTTRSRRLDVERCEARLLLAVDVVIDVDEFSVAEVGDQVTRIVRVFNNGDEAAVDAVVRSSIAGSLDNATWSREAGFAHQIPVASLAEVPPDMVITGPPVLRNVNALGDIDADGLLDVSFMWSADDGRHLSVVYGQPGEFTGSSIVASSGFEIFGSSDNRPVGIGDVNHDGLNDFVVANHVIFGNANRMSDVRLRSLTPQQGFAIGNDPWVTIQRAGDINADGAQDLFLSIDGAPVLLWGGTNLTGLGSVSLSEIQNASSELVMQLPVASETAAPGAIVSILLGGPDVTNRAEPDDGWFSIANLLGLSTYTFTFLPLSQEIGDVNADGIDDLLLTFRGGECDDCTATDKDNIDVDGGVAIVFGSTDLGQSPLVNANGWDGISLRINLPYLDLRPIAYGEDRNGDGITDVVLTVGQRQFVVFGGASIGSHDFGSLQRGSPNYRGFNGVDGYSTSRPRLFSPVDVDGDGSLERFQHHTGCCGIRQSGFWLGSYQHTFPLPLGKSEQGVGLLEDIVDIPAGESMIYTIRGTLKAADDTTTVAATVAPRLSQLEHDLHDNVFPRTEAAYLDASIAGHFVAGESSVDLLVTNHGPHPAEVRVESPLGDLLTDANWTASLQAFPNSLDTLVWDLGHGPSQVLAGNERLDGTSPVGSLGDINGDGFDDLQVRITSENGQFDTRIVFGGEDFGDDGTFGSSTGFLTISDTGDQALVGIGDVNADGIDDMLSHQRKARPNQTQLETFLIFGRTNFSTLGDATTVRFSALGPNSIRTLQVSGRSGFPSYAHVESVGDFNADGIDDLIVGSRLVFGSLVHGQLEGLLTKPTAENSVRFSRSSSKQRLQISTVGDVNGDGIDDIAVAVSEVDPGVALLFGGDHIDDLIGSDGVIDLATDADHRFYDQGADQRATYQLASGGNHDLNGDGIHDLVMQSTSRGGQTYVVYGQSELIGRETDLGIIESSRGFTLASSEQAELPVAVGDINGDGFDDVAATLGDADGVVSLGGVDQQGLADRQIRIRGSIDSFDGLLQLTSELDVNGDGIEDLLIQDPGAGEIDDSWVYHTGIAFMLIGRRGYEAVGTGELNATVNIPTGGVVTFHVSGTLREDALPTAFQAFPTTAVELNPTQSQLQLGPAPTQPTTSIRFESRVANVQLGDDLTGNDLTSGDGELADLDGDGDLDLFVTVSDGPSQIWFNDGSGQFSDSGQRLGRGEHFYAALADVDGDGDIDAVVAAAAGSRNRLWLNDGRGVYSDSGWTLGDPQVSSIDLAFADFDLDGDADLYMANADGHADWLFYILGDGRFTISPQTSGAETSKGVEVADVNGDGYPDVVLATNDNASRVLLNNYRGIDPEIAGGFVVGARIPANAEHIAVGDLDGDGDIDLVTAEPFNNRIWINDGVGRFHESPITLGESLTSHLALADLDDDGDLDIVAANWRQASRIWINESGLFFDSGLAIAPASRSEHITIGDVDADGDLDVYFAVQGGHGTLYRNALHSPPKPGDIDGGGTVGFADFLILSQAYGKTDATHVDGDLDDDQKVDFRDFLILSHHFGR